MDRFGIFKLPIRHQSTYTIYNLPSVIFKLPIRHQSVGWWGYIHGCIFKLPIRHQSNNSAVVYPHCFFKLPIRHQSRTRHTINLVYKKAKSNFGYKNPFFKWLFNALIFNGFILFQKKGLTIRWFWFSKWEGSTFLRKVFIG